MKLIFRKLDPKNQRDIEEFCVLMDDLSQRADDVEQLKVNIAGINAEENSYLMVAQDALSGRLCGSIMAFICPDFCGPCRPFMLIENVVTHSEFRRLGVAEEMFKYLEQWGQQRGVRYTILCSSNDRSAAHRFYPAIGYKEIKGYKKFL